jgi:hypothetical protein
MEYIGETIKRIIFTSCGLDPIMTTVEGAETIIISSLGSEPRLVVTERDLKYPYFMSCKDLKSIEAITEGIMSQVYYQRLIDNSVANYHYLLERGWYMEDPKLQLKLIKVVEMGLSTKVNVLADNFSIHLDELIMEETTRRFCHL